MNQLSLLSIKELIGVGLMLTLCPFRTLAAEESLRSFPSPSATAETPVPVQWNLPELFEKPEMYSAESESGFKENQGISPIFFDGVPFNGKPTRVFAWVGIPQKASGAVPGIVLVHGGGGTAYRDWVKLWMGRGYAAIAIDTCGAMPQSADGMVLKTSRHGYSGAPFSAGGFATSRLPVEDQWLYHAVAATIRAHSLLRNLPEVDKDRTGITGVSWGGVITELAISVDTRFKFAAPVYGCGFLGENSFWLETEFQKLPSEAVERWIALWDPSQYLSHAEMPVLLCNGTNDKHFRPDSWQKTYRTLNGARFLSLKVRMPHDHPPAGDPPEIMAFANAIVQGGEPLAMIDKQSLNAEVATVHWVSTLAITKAELVYTTDSGDWTKRYWKTQAARIDSGSTASANIPPGATAYYFNLYDTRNCIVSSEHWSSSNNENFKR